MTIKIENIAQPTGERRKVAGRGELPWYTWRVWVDEDPTILDQIESVEYLLHPTFLRPRRISKDRVHNFELVSAGWGQFWIEVTIVFKDFHEEQISYWLDFSKRGEVPVEPLISALKDKKDVDVRWSAAEALGRIGDTKAVEPLIEALKDEHGPVRFTAAEALGRIGAEAVEPQIGSIIGLLNDKQPSFVRVSAARALGAIGSAKAIEPLTKRLKDGHIPLRTIAKDALYNIRAKQKSK